jgi:two-component system, sensor histidine kinase and response regulator
VQHEAHSLKGAAASLGLVRLQQLAARIEAQCKAGHLPTAAEVARLDETLADTCRAAHAHLAGAGQPASASSPP